MVNPFKEIIEFREVLWNFFTQEFKVKYKRTFFGFLWSLLNPIFYLLVLSLVFSHVVRLEVQDYAKFLFAGLIPWTFFQLTITHCMTAFIDSENLIKKVYLPKIIFPLSKVMIRGFDFLVSFIALIILGFILGFKLDWPILLTPLAVLSISTLTLGAGILVSVFTVYFRDMIYITGVFLQLLYFATPILYPLSTLPPKYQAILALNPLTHQIKLFQDLIYTGVIPTTGEWTLAFVTSAAFLLAGLLVLQTREQDLVFRL